MGRLIKFISLFLVIFLAIQPSFSALTGGLEYTIPIDYKNLSTEELESKAEIYYNNALKSNSKSLNSDVTSALNLYAMLSNKNPENITYALRLGKLYDMIGKDRYAKGNYYRAMGINQNRPEPFFYLGNFFYERQQYRRALKMYKEAYEKGYSDHYQTLFALGDIYQKFGDTQSALKYLEAASKICPNEELDKKIKQVQNADNINKEYYRR